MNPKFYLTGILLSIGVISLSVVLSGGLSDPLDEIGPIAAVMLLIFLPFCALPFLGSGSKAALVSLTVVSAAFWLGVLAVAATSTGGANIGLGLVGIASPLFVIPAAIAVAAVWEKATRGSQKGASDSVSGRADR